MARLLTIKGGRGESSSWHSLHNRFTRRGFMSGGLALFTAAGLLPARAGFAQEEGETSQQARDEAIRSLPLRELTGETRRKLMAVCERPTIYRRLPQQSIVCDPQLHQFLVRNPEVTVNIWDLMGVAHMAADRQGPYQWKGSDGAGTTCDVELVYGTENMHIIYSDGYYEGALLKHRVTGRCVLALKTAHAIGADRRAYVANRADLFLQLDNAAADVVARTLSPWVGKVADANFHESCVFASKLSQTAEQNAPGVQRLAEKLTRVEQPIRDEFSRLAVAVQTRAAQREATAPIRR